MREIQTVNWMHQSSRSESVKSVSSVVKQEIVRRVAGWFALADPIEVRLAKERRQADMQQ